MTTAQRPTLEAVAARAGVSRATVSRVVNGSTTVAEPIREAVTRAVAELGYVPNLAARSLVTQRTDSIALVMPEAATRVFSDDQVFPGIIRGVSQELEAADKQLVLMLAGSPAGHQRVERYTTGRHVDGVLFASLHGADPLPGTLARLGIPVVCSGRPLGDVPRAVRRRRPRRRGDHSRPAPDRQRSAADRHHRRPAGHGRRDRAAQRLPQRGRRRGAARAGRRTATSPASPVRRRCVALLAEHPDLDAVFAASDLMAHAALRTLREAGRRVPDDVAVIGFDDIETAAYTEPPLTTVRQPIVELGRRMTRQLLRLAAGEEIEQALMLPTELILRESA